MTDEIVYDGWLKVARRKIQDRTFDILKDYDAVAAIIVNENKCILLVKQFRPALMRETLEIPSGTMDDDRESDLDCLLRELKEETHLDFHPEEARLAVSYNPNVGFSNSLMKIYHIELPGSDCKSWTAAIICIFTISAVSSRREAAKSFPVVIYPVKVCCVGAAAYTAVAP